MVVPLRVLSPRMQMLFANWIAASDAASSRVEGALTRVAAVVEVAAPVEPEAHAVKVWKSSDQLS